MENTLKDFPGLVFDHYAVHISNSGGSSFIKVEELKAKQMAGAKEMKVSLKKSVADETQYTEENVNICDLLPSPLNHRISFVKTV